MLYCTNSYDGLLNTKQELNQIQKLGFELIKYQHSSCLAWKYSCRRDLFGTRNIFDRNEGKSLISSLKYFDQLRQYRDVNFEDIRLENRLLINCGNDEKKSFFCRDQKYPTGSSFRKDSCLVEKRMCIHRWSHSNKRHAA